MSGPQPANGEEFAWKVHDAINDWTARVDVKASIVLALETAVVGGLIALSGDGKPLANLTGADVYFYRAGLVALVVATLLAAFVVMPQLRRRKTKQEWKGRVIFFGHLRFWQPTDLAGRLEGIEPTTLEQLSSQLVEMSKIAWRKHAWLQASIWLLIVGCGLLAVTRL